MRPAPVRTAVALAACLSLAAAATSAQGSVGPAILRGAQRAAGFDAAQVPATYPHHMHFVQLLTDPEGVYAASLSVLQLQTAYGGAGTRDVLTGKYDSRAQRFVPDRLAAGLNGPDGDTNLMLHRSGVWGTMERFAGGTWTTWVVRRPTPQDAWVLHGQIAGFGSYFPERQPALVDVDAELHVLFSNANRVELAPLQIGNLALGAPRVVARTDQPGAALGYPSPILDAGGNLAGLTYQVRPSTAESDLWIAFDLDPATPAQPLIDANTYTGAGTGIAGGAFFTQQTPPTPTHIVDLHAHWLGSLNARPGDVARIDLHLPPGEEAALAQSFVLLAAAFTPGTTIPGFGNRLGLDPLSAAGVLAAPYDMLTGRASAVLRLPADPRIAGLRVPLQGLTRLGDQTWTFTNTGSLTVAAPLPPGLTMAGNTFRCGIDLEMLADAPIRVLRAPAPHSAFSILDARGQVERDNPVDVELTYTAATGPVRLTTQLVVDHATGFLLENGLAIRTLGDVFRLTLPPAQPTGQLAFACRFHLVVFCGKGLPLGPPLPRWVTDTGKEIQVKADGWENVPDRTPTQERQGLAFTFCNDLNRTDALRGTRDPNAPANGEASDAFNCHGLTFLDGQGWIDDPADVDAILKDNYQRIDPAITPPQAGDVVIIRAARDCAARIRAGTILHSETVVRVNGAEVIARGKHGAAGTFLRDVCGNLNPYHPSLVCAAGNPAWASVPTTKEFYRRNGGRGNRLAQR